jgi:hypothetical protein
MFADCYDDNASFLVQVSFAGSLQTLNVHQLNVALHCFSEQFKIKPKQKFYKHY